MSCEYWPYNPGLESQCLCHDNVLWVLTLQPRVKTTVSVCPRTMSSEYWPYNSGLEPQCLSQDNVLWVLTLQLRVRTTMSVPGQCLVSTDLTTKNFNVCPRVGITMFVPGQCLMSTDLTTQGWNHNVCPRTSSEYWPYNPGLKPQCLSQDIVLWELTVQPRTTMCVPGHSLVSTDLHSVGPRI